MNHTIFDIKRFTWLVKEASSLGSWKNILIIGIIPSITLTIIFVIYSITDYSINADNLPGGQTMSEYILSLNEKYIIIMFALYVSSQLLIAPYLMNSLNSKKKRIQYLMLPGSSLEKFLSRFLPLTIGYTVLFFFSFWLMDIIRVAICTPLFPQMDVHMLDFNLFINSDNSNALFSNYTEFFTFIAYFILVYSYFILGSTYFTKRPFASILVFLAILIFILSKYTILLMKWLGKGTDIYQNKYLNPEYLFFEINPPLIMAICLSLTIFNCVIAYYRFKETELVQRG